MARAMIGSVMAVASQLRAERGVRGHRTKAREADGEKDEVEHGETPDCDRVPYALTPHQISMLKVVRNHKVKIKLPSSIDTARGLGLP